MSKVEMTVQQIMDLGLWEQVCTYKGWDTWILNEGKIGEYEIVEFDSEFKKEEVEKKTDKFIIQCPKCGQTNTTISLSIHQICEIRCEGCGFSESHY